MAVKAITGMSWHSPPGIDSGHLSSSMGLSVLYAAHLAQNHASKDQIVEVVNSLRFIQPLCKKPFIVLHIRRLGHTVLPLSHMGQPDGGGQHGDGKFQPCD